MTTSINDLVLTIATVNGSGSQSSNNVLVKSLFRMGIPVTGKNLFPSNIAGLPTWFTIRANPKGFTARKLKADLVVALNPATINSDINLIKDNGYFLYEEGLAFNQSMLSTNCIPISIPLKKLVEDVTTAPKLKKLLSNMIVVGVLSNWLEIDLNIVKDVVKDTFSKKESVVESNLKAISVGANWASENLLNKINPPSIFKKSANTHNDKILIDGNTASAMGLLFGGCTVMAWYPITPSSSLVENFQDFCHKYRVQNNKNNFAIVQAEDELSSISMVLGAGWAGARAATATSGPGLSLMAEAAGLSYFAEIPAVIWDVQRGGPSTGLPTRTQQADLTSATYLSHGDTEHIILIPNNPNECFEFGQVSFDLAERFQTLVIVLSDLDIGMNFWVSDEFQYSEKPYDRGKVLDAEKLNQMKEFARYKDVDGDGIPYRTIPGTPHPNAAFFTRGTGHDERAVYSENPQVYSRTLDRLKFKFKTAENFVPKPELKLNPHAKIGFIAYGSTDLAISEIQNQLKLDNIESSYLRIRALPLSDEVNDFIDKHDQIYLVEQNRDAQMKSILLRKYPHQYSKVHSLLQYDGMPITPEIILENFYNHRSQKDV